MTDRDEMCAEIDRLQAENKRLRAALESCGWVYVSDDGVDFCDCCDHPVKEEDYTKDDTYTVCDEKCKGAIARAALERGSADGKVDGQVATDRLPENPAPDPDGKNG